MQINSDRQWTDLLLILAEGKPEGVVTLGRMNTIEFFHFQKAWEARQRAILAAHTTG